MNAVTEPAAPYMTEAAKTWKTMFVSFISPDGRRGKRACSILLAFLLPVSGVRQQKKTSTDYRWQVGAESDWWPESSRSYRSQCRGTLVPFRLNLLSPP